MSEEKLEEAIFAFTDFLNASSQPWQTNSVLGFKRGIITWFMNAVQASKKGRFTIDLGLCSHGKGVAFVAVYDPHKPMTEEALRPLIIRDVLFGEGGCDDQRWCFNLSCPLNNTQVRYFHRYGVTNKKDLERIHKLLEKIKHDLKLENKDFGVAVRYEKPPIYLYARKRTGEALKAWLKFPRRLPRSLIL